MTGQDRRVVEGFKLPPYAPPTQNELAWISMLRAIVGDTDPRPTVKAVLALWGALRRPPE
jgi:hypothetical protein